MMKYPERVLAFMGENKESTSSLGGFLISLVWFLSFQLWFIFVLLVFDVITLGRFGFVKKYSNKISNAKAKSAELLPYDQFVYSKSEKKHDTSKLLPIVQKVLAERYDSLLDGEVIQFGVLNQGRGIIFTNERIFYYLVSPKSLSQAAVDGVINVRDVRSLSCAKSFIDSIVIEVNDQKLNSRG